MKLSKLENVRVKVAVTENPSKLNSFKGQMMRWAIAQGEFTKGEFFEAVLRIKKEYEITSKMKDDVLVKAWWSELYSKAKYFRDVE